jgi:putative DNA-invertase from lambdoid prophage Rac
MTRAAIWARVSTTDQHTENQLAELRQWAERRGLEVVQEYAVEDSAWQEGKGKGAEFDRQREALVNGARLGHYQVILIWALDRISRRGIEDTLAVLRRLAEHDTDVWSHEEEWLHTSGETRELLVGISSWIAGQSSARQSARVKAGLARRRAEGLPVGGRRPGAKDKKPRSTAGYSAGWEKRRASG